MTDLRVAVMTYPNLSGPEPLLAKEVELVRSSILYADHVDLVSMNVLLLLDLLNASTLEGFMQLVTSLDDNVAGELGAVDLPDGWRQVLRDGVPLLQMTSDELQQSPDFADADPDVVRQLVEAQQMLTQLLDEYRSGLPDLLVSSGGLELVPAIDSGVVRLPDYSVRGQVPLVLELATLAGRDAQEIVSDWAALLGAILIDPDIRILLDDTTSALARLLVLSEMIVPTSGSVRRTDQAVIGTGLIARLPAFPQAPIDELLDLRSDLNGPLVRYRAAVARMAATVNGPTFGSVGAVELDELWITDAGPAIQEVREALAEHTLVRELARTVSGGVGAVVAATAGPAVYIGLDQMTSLTNLVAGAVAAAGPTAATLFKAGVERSDQHRAVRSHDLFFLYELDRRLG